MQPSCFNNDALFRGHSAMLVNEGLPHHAVKRAAQRYDLSNMTVGILGMTRKADSEDPRDSLSFKLEKSLQVERREVLCSDPFLDDPTLVPLAETIERAELLFIGAPHTVYRTQDFRGKPVIDIWNAARGGTTVL